MRGTTTIVIITLVIAITAATAYGVSNTKYTFTDVHGLGRTFDAVGGLSGGGGTSVLLWTYPEKERSEILDYLFLPNFGASLQLLKVEIGGDAQSTDGSEPSYQHTRSSVDYDSGYELWLMREALKRNPKIKLYGLPWAWPKWISCEDDLGLVNCTNSPWRFPAVAAEYIVNWCRGVRERLGVTDSSQLTVGSWNERSFSVDYLVLLKKKLVAAGFPHTRIIAADDAGWAIASAVLANATLKDSLFGLGSHYPGTKSTPSALRTGLPLWSSEDASNYNNAVGAGCLARIINQNYVNGDMTATIVWNLMSAYPKGTRWYRAGLGTAMHPWARSYGTFYFDGRWSVGPMLWVAAHTTQFTRADGTWRYLKHGDGAGHLKNGGSFVVLKDANKGDFTVVVEKMSRAFSSCVRPVLLPFDTEEESAIFTLDGELLQFLRANAQPFLWLWETHFAHHDDDRTIEFEPQGKIAVNLTTGIVAALRIRVNSLYTLTTLATGKKGSFPSSNSSPPPPQPSLFPTAHVDNFDDCRSPFTGRASSAEARYFLDQNGIFECVETGDPARSIVLQQMIPARPISWGNDIRPHSLVGHRDMKNLSLSIDALIRAAGASAMIGVRMQHPDDSQGLIFATQAAANASSESWWGLWTSMAAVSNPKLAVARGSFSSSSSFTVRAGEWHTYRMDCNGTKLNVWIDFPKHQILKDFDVSSWLYTKSGFAMIGTKLYNEYTRYDNFALFSEYAHPSATAPPAAGDRVCVVECSSEVGLVDSSLWRFTGFADRNNNKNKSAAAGTLSLRKSPQLCLTANKAAASDEPWWLSVETCNSTNAQQSWTFYIDGISPDHERQSFLYTTVVVENQKSTDRCIDIYRQLPEIGATMDAWPCNGGSNQAFFYDYDAGQVANEATATCLGVCKP